MYRTYMETSDVRRCRAMSTSGEHRKVVGAGIRAVREQRDISQEDLAMRIGKKRQHLSDWERGIHTPSHANLEKLAEALECHWTTFYTVGDGEATAA